MRREQELKDLEEKMMKILPMHFRNPKEGKKDQLTIPRFPEWA